MDGFGSFAKQYDTAIAKFGGVGDASDKSSEFNKIKESFATVGKTDSNVMYDIINSTVFPVIGDSEFINITTKAFYEKDNQWLIDKGLAGTAHGQRLGGLGVDLGT